MAAVCEERGYKDRAGDLIFDTYARPPLFISLPLNAPLTNLLTFFHLLPLFLRLGDAS